MKHNTFFVQMALTTLTILFSFSLMAKVVSSEFLNQATYGSEGPQLSEVEVDGRSIYLLKYLYKGKDDLIKTLSRDEYLKIQTQMNSFFEKKPGSDSESACERELVYTKVENENKVSNQILCWQDINSDKRIEVSQWISDIQRKVESIKIVKK